MAAISQNPFRIASGIVATMLATACAQAPDPISPPPHVHVADAVWETVWRDDFDGVELDRSKWSPEVTCWGGGNNERQCYTDRATNIQVSDGVLHLKALPETFTGSSLHADDTRNKAEQLTRSYTSGKVRTRNLASWTYGRFTARMKLPPGQGAWPAFWMMPEADVYGDWPLSGEIDIMEAVNLQTPCADCDDGIERRTSGALHFGDLPPQNTYLFHRSGDAGAPGPSEEWRTYSVEWADGVIQWFVNDKIFMRIESADWFTKASNAAGRPHAPFDQPFYLILNLAVGGNLPEKSNNGGFQPDTFPAELLVDWIKVEQCSKDHTGRSCLSQQDWDGTPQGPWEVDAR